MEDLEDGCPIHSRTHRADRRGGRAVLHRWRTGVWLPTTALIYLARMPHHAIILQAPRTPVNAVCILIQDVSYATSDSWCSRPQTDNLQLSAIP